MPHVVEKLDGLLVLPSKEFTAAVNNMKDFSKHERSDLMKNSDIAEAWVGRMNRELVSGNVETVKAMTQLGDQLLSVLIEKPKNLLQTNICECFIKWIKAISLKKLKHSNDILTLCMVILESSEIATEMYSKITSSLMKLIIDNHSSGLTVNTARNAAETLMLGHCDVPQNRKYVDVVRIVEIFKNTQDVPLRETLLVIIRKCIVKFKSDSSARTKAINQLLHMMSQQEFNAIEHTGSTETGTLEFVCKMVDKNPTQQIKILKASNATINGKQYNSEMMIFATPTYLTYQQPNEIRWVDVMFNKLSVKELNTKAVQLTTSEGTAVFTTRNPKSWIAAVKGLPEKKISNESEDDDDDDDDEVCRKSIRRTNKKRAMELESPFKEDTHVQKRQKSVVRIPTESLLREPSRIRQSYKPLSEKWEPPQDLFRGKDWIDSDDDEDDQEEEMEKMQLVLSSCLDKKEKAQIQELEEVSKEVHHLVNRHKEELETERSELSGFLTRLEEDIKRQETTAHETHIREKKITKDVMALHGQFVQTVRIAKREFQEINADLDDILPCNEDLNTQIMKQIESMTQRGLSVLQKKAKKRGKKSETVMKMFSMITQEFATAR